MHTGKLKLPNLGASHHESQPQAISYFTCLFYPTDIPIDDTSAAWSVPFSGGVGKIVESGKVQVD